MADVLRGAPSREVAAVSPAAYWAAMKEEATWIVEAGGETILLVATEVHPPWLSDWIRRVVRPGGAKPPEDLNVVYERGLGRDYIGTLNGVRVHKAPVATGASLLQPEGLLHHLEFTLWTDGHPLRAEFERKADDPWHGDLRLVWARRIGLGEGEIVRLVYGPIEQVDGAASIAAES